MTTLRLSVSYTGDGCMTDCDDRETYLHKWSRVHGKTGCLPLRQNDTYTPMDVGRCELVSSLAEHIRRFKDTLLISSLWAGSKPGH